MIVLDRANVVSVQRDCARSLAVEHTAKIHEPAIALRPSFIAEPKKEQAF
jgi:hypothetical protein